jgi:hypothetical protein
MTPLQTQRQCGECKKVFLRRYDKIRHQMAAGTPCRDTTEHEQEQSIVRERQLIARRSAEKKGILKAKPKTYKRITRRCPVHECSGMFSKAAMALHRKHEHASTQCTLCHKVFCSVATMQRHIHETHASKVSERCPQCGKKQKRPSAHKKRCKGAASPKAFQCPVEQCAAAFTRERNLTAHIKTRHHHHQELFGEEEEEEEDDEEEEEEVEGVF